jgi:hypothetical protein
MRLYPEDPRLSAYALGELDAEEAAAVESAAAADPSLQQVIDDSAAMQGLLEKRLAIRPVSMLPKQRENVLRASQGELRLERSAAFASFFEIMKPRLIPAAAVLVLSAATLILLQMPDDEAPPLAQKSPPTQAPVAAAEPPPPLKPTPPWSPHRGSVKVADFPTFQVPIQVGSGNLDLIRKSILDEEKLPDVKQVRLEEILNAFPLRLNGVTALAKRPAGNWHPDNRDSGITSHLATLSTEMIACPWKPSATLLLVSLRGNVQADCEAKLVFRPNPSTVLRYRLLGSTSDTGEPAASSSSSLAAKAATTLAIEIEPSGADLDFGALEWFINSAQAPSISLMRNDEAEPSNDARFAVLACTYAQWLAGEQVGFIDADIVAALAREVASGKLEADRVEFLSIIDKSLHL